MEDEEKDSKIQSPSQFYRSKRPEFFSDSSLSYEFELPREVLAFELEKISTNQKQDQFETLCRRLAEKLIAPNLIPQVGPTGGGDGKTDAETYPVSDFISERWFIPDNGWNNDQKWAFAFSSKKEWREKVKKDVEKIIGTNRGYTKIFFISNQKIPSKQKKQLQDELELFWKVAIIILDGEWILESIYSNGFFDIVINSLNLSDVFKKQKGNIGLNDNEREHRLEEIEQDIANPKRYFEYDFQLVEDALEAAILSRMLEKPKQEIESKFDRALRFCEKIKSERQLVRIYYQQAFTYLNWYDDYIAFCDYYKRFKNLLSKHSPITEIELYVNLFNLLSVINSGGLYDLQKSAIEFEKEKHDLVELLNAFINDEGKISSSLIAQSYLSIFYLMDSLREKTDYSVHIKNLAKQIETSGGYLEYPFEQFLKLIEHFGKLFPNDPDYDNLFDVVAAASQKRSSEREAGEIFLKRGLQKLKAEFYKESIVYFGKAVLKLAKEETRKRISMALTGLGIAYRKLDLLWASNNCYITATSLLIKTWFQSGKIETRTLSCLSELLKNELFIGRIPNFLLWHELYTVLKNQINAEEVETEDMPEDLLNDACLSIRILYSKSTEGFEFLPWIFEKAGLELCELASLYQLGYSDILLNKRNDTKISSKEDWDLYFSNLAKMEFASQMLYETELLTKENIHFSSKILGVHFIIEFKKDKELVIAAEAILAFLEAFLGTSLSEIFPVSEKIHIQLLHHPVDTHLEFKPLEQNNKYQITLNSFAFRPDSIPSVWEKFMEFTAQLLTRNFMVQDIKTHLNTLFAKEEVNERIALIWDYRRFLMDITGSNPKTLLVDWQSSNSQIFLNKRTTPLKYSSALKRNTKSIFSEFNQVPHSSRTVHSVIDNLQWQNAKWQAFGAAVFNDHFGIILGFANEDGARKIFTEWIDRFGKKDKEDIIRVSIIKGISRTNANWYRIHVTGKQYEPDNCPSQIIFTLSNVHEMQPESSHNLEVIAIGLERFKKYVLYPAITAGNSKGIETFYDLGISKNELHIRWAWEIGENDIDSAAIKKNDSPYIPQHVTNAPVLALLQRKNRN